jgi:TonB-linked SusC/RagA family outer membrane protein
VLTDEQGKYALQIKATRGVVLFSYTGFITQEHQVNGSAMLNIVLLPRQNSLDSLVVVGYGTQRKRDLTGSVASIGSKEISAVASTNMLQAVQGRISGVNISQDTWQPGATSTVRIRGSRSITASNDPLYVIDGNPMSRGSLTINDINPSDIESMEVLKDASATAIYGSRGANGVILITTRRGKAGKTMVDYSGYEGVQKPLRTIDVWNGGEYAEYVRDSYRTTGAYTSPTPNEDQDKALAQFAQDPYVLESVLMGYDDHGNYDPSRVRSFDWMKAVMQTGYIRSHELSISGGNDKTKTLVSGGYFGNKGLIKNMDYKRYNIRVNLDHQVNKWLKASTSTMISRVNQNIGSNLYALARTVNPLASPYDAEGKLMLNPGNDPLTPNPLLDIDGIVNDSRKDRILSNINLEAKIINGLRYRMNFGYDYRTARDGSFQKTMSTARAGKTPWASYGGNYSTDIILENLLFYDKTLWKDHRIGVTLLQSMQTNRFETFSTSAQGLPYESQEFYNLGSASEILSTASRLEKSNMLSLMGRINYAYKGKYLLTLTARRDGSSVLAEGRKYQLFPSAALAWRIGDEGFMEKAGFVNDLKLRMSYGKTGNSAINPYQTQGTLSLVRYAWDESVMIGYGPGTMPNPYLSWETTAQTDIGLDFSFFNSRITGTFEAYQSNTSGLLMPRKLPVVSGFPEVLTNVGKTRNRGIELSLSSVNLETRSGLRWSTGIVFSKNKEEIVELVNGKQDDVGNNWFIGQPASNVFYDQKVIGVWQNTPEDLAEMAKFNANGHNFKPGYIRLADKNGDYKITTDDRYILGSRRPKWTGSLTNDISFRQFDLSFQFYISQGAMGIFDKGLALNGRMNMMDIDYWTPQRPSNKYPMANAGWLGPDYIYESSYEDASYIRLRYVTLGYTLPQALKVKAGLSNLRIYLSAQNPYLHSKFDGLDPEGAQGFDAPSTKTFILGINASF